MNAVSLLKNEIGIKKACNVLNISRGGFYRWNNPKEKKVRLSPLALSFSEKNEALSILHEDRFIDKAPQEIYAALLDENKYICSIRTMYRILEKEGEIKERRNHLIRPHYKKPELITTTPNQVWSWDITKLKGPVKWTYYYLYVILDIFSRYVVGWMIAHR